MKQLTNCNKDIHVGNTVCNASETFFCMWLNIIFTDQIFRHWKIFQVLEIDFCSGTHQTKPVPNVLQETSGVILTNAECQAYWTTNYQSAPHICIHNTVTGTCQVSQVTGGVNLKTSDIGLHHTISLMYVGYRHLGFARSPIRRN